MRTIVFALAFAVVGLIAGDASAREVTVINVSQGEVKKQCEGRTSCMGACGNTYCDFVCDDPSKQCTVTVFRRGQVNIRGRNIINLNRTTVR